MKIHGARTLAFVHNGTVELHNRLDEPLWKSSDHAEFAEEFGTFVSVDEVEDVLEWLVQEGVISSREADQLDISEDSLTDEDEDEDEDAIADDDGDDY